jgi:hypothetical protein
MDLIPSFFSRQHGRAVRRLDRTPLADGKESRDPVILVGIVTDFRIINGQRGKLALFQLDDRTWVLEVSADENLINSHRSLRKDDELIIVQAQAQARPRAVFPHRRGAGGLDGAGPRATRRDRVRLKTSLTELDTCQLGGWGFSITVVITQPESHHAHTQAHPDRQFGGRDPAQGNTEQAADRAW